MRRAAPPRWRCRPPRASRDPPPLAPPHCSLKEKQGTPTLRHQPISDTVKEQVMDSRAEMHARPCPTRIARTPASSTPPLYNEHGFAVVNVVIALLMFRNLPETRGVSLEQVERGVMDGSIYPSAGKR